MIKEYIKENQDRILEELFSLIRIPSVSAQPDKHGADMVRCAERWKELLLMAGVNSSNQRERTVAGFSRETSQIAFELEWRRGYFHLCAFAIRG